VGGGGVPHVTLVDLLPFASVPQAPDSKVFALLASTKAGGLGLNLCAADTGACLQVSSPVCPELNSRAVVLVAAQGTALFVSCFHPPPPLLLPRTLASLCSDPG
jgi:hypothetical protein